MAGRQIADADEARELLGEYQDTEGSLAAFARSKGIDRWASCSICNDPPSVVRRASKGGAPGCRAFWRVLAVNGMVLTVPISWLNVLATLALYVRARRRHPPGAFSRTVGISMVAAGLAVVPVVALFA